MSVEWPPPFDSENVAYIFDARSGFFYEASDFFMNLKVGRFHYCQMTNVFRDKIPHRK